MSDFTVGPRDDSRGPTVYSPLLARGTRLRGKGNCIQFFGGTNTQCT